MNSDKIKHLEKRICQNLSVSDFRNVPIYRIEKPIKPFRAKTLGCKTTPGFIYVICRIRKGGTSPFIPPRGRKPSKINQKLSRDVSKFEICVNRVSRIYPNLKYFTGYPVFENGKYKWYEIVLKDPVIC